MIAIKPKIGLIGFIFLGTILFSLSCKKNFDKFYERPTNLEPAIYQQLSAKGNFTNFLTLIDKAGYKQTLSAAGYWTIFAPTDSAFQNDAEFTAFISARGFANVAAVDSTTAQMLVQYLLVYNAFDSKNIDDYQAPTGWVPDNAFKRRTAYYTSFYSDTSYTGQVIKSIASNRNNNGVNNGYFVVADNNNKYIPYFTNQFFSTKGLTAADYNYFYPSSVFTGFNIDKAKVTSADIVAENGIIHIIDKVVTPLKSIDQYLRDKPQYSVFRNLLERFMVLFVNNADATRKYQVLTGSSDNIAVKVYSNLMAFSPNNENYFKLQDNDGQRDGWTMFVPNNDSLNKYINNVVLQSYPSVNSLPLSIISDLINSHMFQSTVWPSKFINGLNYLGEPARYSAATDIAEKKILSNGIFYGTKKVNEPNAFSTVYGKSYLNPNYSIMTRLLDVELKPLITNPNIKYTLFLISDAVFAAKGYTYNSGANSWSYTPPVVGWGVASTNDSNRINLLRMINSGVIEMSPTNTLAGIGNTGVSGITVTYGGEFIKYNNNTVITAGSQERNVTIRIDSVRQVLNGQVVYVNDLLYFPYRNIGQDLGILGTPAASQFNYFWNYLKNSTMFNTTTSEITGIGAGSFYTVFVPQNSSIVAAINAGLLPGTAGVPNYTPTLTADKVLVEKFLQYHFLDKRTVIANGLDVGSFPSLLRNTAGDPVTFAITYPLNVFEITDANARKARMVAGFNNNLSNRCVIHLVDNYLKY